MHAVEPQRSAPKYSRLHEPIYHPHQPGTREPAGSRLSLLMSEAPSPLPPVDLVVGQSRTSFSSPFRLCGPPVGNVAWLLWRGPCAVPWALGRPAEHHMSEQSHRPEAAAAAAAATSSPSVTAIVTLHTLLFWPRFRLALVSFWLSGLFSVFGTCDCDCMARVRARSSPCSRSL